MFSLARQGRLKNGSASYVTFISMMTKKIVRTAAQKWRLLADWQQVPEFRKDKNSEHIHHVTTDQPVQSRITWISLNNASKTKLRYYFQSFAQVLARLLQWVVSSDA